jgi:hypothetical protein
MFLTSREDSPKITRQIKYVNRDFPDLMQELTNYAKQYFPSTFSNFNDYSPEMMLMEQMAYVGDVLNFYLDDRFKELFIKYAEEPQSIFRDAKFLGYKPQTVSVSVGYVTFSQLVPAILGEDGFYIPDENFCAVINEGSTVSSITGTNIYTTTEKCDMTDYDEFVIVELDGNNTPTLIRIYKETKIRSGINKQKRFNLVNPVPNLRLFIDESVAFIESITDSEGNRWWEVDYLAQDTIFESIENLNINPEYDLYNEETPYLLRTRRASRRFIVDHLSDGSCYVQFGSGTDVVESSTKPLTTDDLLTTNEVASLATNNVFVVENYLRNDSYGLTPYGTTLTINYVTSLGERENTKINNISTIVNVNAIFKQSVTDDISNSFEVNNDRPVLGAGKLNSPERIRFEAPEAYQAQHRCVTNRDYIIRAKIMPSKFGKVEKVFVEKDYDYLRLRRLNDDRIANKALNIYVLSKNKDGRLSYCNAVTKNNLKTYLSEFRMVTDTINILNPFIINIGVEFNYISQREFNHNEVFLNISKKIEEYFNIDNWEINQPIILEDLRYAMYEAEGVLAITNINFVNKVFIEDGYSGIAYNVDVNGSNFDNIKGVLYPPADVGIFELKYPKLDIKGRHV